MLTSVGVPKRLSVARADKPRSFKIATLYLFSLVARGELDPNNDLDFVMEFVPSVGFDEYMDLKSFLKELFGQRMDR